MFKHVDRTAWFSIFTILRLFEMAQYGKDTKSGRPIHQKIALELALALSKRRMSLGAIFCSKLVN